jgi:predicted DNA-binding protein
VAIPSELKNRLNKMATGQGKKVSALIRESIEETLARMERDLFVEKMREAYLGMAEENLNTAEEFKYADAENL